MADYIVSCCSSADISPEWMAKRNLTYLCHSFFLNDQEYKDDLWVSMKPEEMYRRMNGGYHNDGYRMHEGSKEKEYDEGYRTGYEHGYKDHEQDENWRRMRDSRGRYM